MKKYAFGVDIGGTTVKIGLFETSGKLAQKWEIPTRKETNGTKILPDIADSLAAKIDELGISKDDVAGIGIDVPGPILDDEIVNRCVNLGWGVFNVAERVRTLTGISEVKVANDANAAALGEMWQGGGENHQTLLWLPWGLVSAAALSPTVRLLPVPLVLLVKSVTSWLIRKKPSFAAAARRATWNNMLLQRGIARRAKEVLTSSNEPSALRDIKDPDAKAVFDCAKDGDKLALEIVDFVGETLGTALASVSCVFDPEVYVIGGGVSKAGQILIDTVQKHFVAAAFHASEGAEFALAKLGNDAGMYGAVKMVL